MLYFKVARFPICVLTIKFHFHFNSLSLWKWTFPEGLGGLCHTCGNSEGVGGHQFPAKMENPGRWGVLSEIPSVVGVWIFSGTTQFRPCDVLQGINLAFIFFLNHAYSFVLLCRCMHTYRTTLNFDLSSSLGYHLLVWNDRKTKHTS